MPDHRRAPRYPIHVEPQISPFASLRHDLMALKACVAALKLIKEMKYSELQPGWPEGHPLGGQWKPKESGEGEEENTEAAEGFGEAPDGTPIEPVGGVPESEKGSTVQSFMSRYCNAGIRAEMPGQLLGMTILEVMQLAKQGDAAARTCMKLLSRGRFQK